MSASSASPRPAHTIRGRLTRSFGRHGTTVLVAALTAMVVAAGPTVAATAVSLARNAMAVDGQSATKYTTSKTTRKNKLVATNKFGFLPNNIISKADNANKLDGLDSTAFLRSTAKASDADTLDGLDSTAFLGASAKAADANTVDGLDSTAFLGASATATDSGMLDGLDSTAFLRPSKVVHVSADGTAAENGADLVSALAGISGATATVQYLVQLEPGTYDVGSSELTLPGFVHLAGAGMTATAITGTGTTGGSSTDCLASNVACVLELDGVSEVRDVLVRNTGGTDADNSKRVAIYSDGSTATLRRVHAFTTGALYTSAPQTGWRSALYVTGVPPVVLESTLQSKDGFVNYAIRIEGASADVLRVERSRLVSSGAGPVYFGVATLTGTSSVAIRDSYVQADNTAISTAGSAGSVMRVSNSVVSGAVEPSLGTMYVAQSQILGSVSVPTGAGDIVCVGAYNPSFVALNTDCG